MITNLKTLILAAAAEGKITLAMIDDGDMFESVEEWIEYAGDNEIEALAEAAKLVAIKPIDNEIFYNDARQRARWAGIKGA